MAGATTTNFTEVLRTTRQIRQYKPDPVPKEVVDQLLEVARWTGSSQNTQPWRFVVIDDKATITKISQFRDRINWLAAAPLAIAIVMDGKNQMSESFDEGRVTERLLITAHGLGLGGGTAWYGEESHRAEAKRLLGIPEEMMARQVVAIGYPITYKDPRGVRANPGRKPVAEVVSYNRFGQSSR
jgi:nitroreductase